MSDKDRYGKDNEIKKNERRVVQDSNNSDIYRGGNTDRATLSFDFENKPAKTERKPSGSSQRRTARQNKVSRTAGQDKVTKPSKQKKVARQIVSDKDVLPELGAKPDRPVMSDKPSGRYGLDGYVTPDIPDTFSSEKRKADGDSKKPAEGKSQSINSKEVVDAIRKKISEVKNAASQKIAESRKPSNSKNASDKTQTRTSSGTAAGKTSGNRKTAVRKQEPKKTTSKKSSSRKPASLKAAASKIKSKKPKKKSVSKSKRKRSKAYRYAMAALKVFVALCLVGGITGGAYVAYTIAHAPKIHPEDIYSTLDVSTHIYDDKGELISDLYYEENREIARYDQFPDNLKNAFIAVEDKTFWEHKGVNLKRIFGAVWNSLTGGGEISGTSTITQQLARNVFLPEEKSIRSIKRKIIEIYYAKEIEEVLSKEDILTAYLNTIYLGYGCYGVDTAAKRYFSTDVENLTLEQCAALAALPQAPGVYALLTEEPEEGMPEISDGLYVNDISQERRYMVLDLMAQQGYITQEEADAAKKPAADFLVPGKDYGGYSSAFKDYLIQTVINDLMTQYQMDEDQARNMVYSKGLRIYSTMDSQAQRVITKEFKNKKSFPDALRDNSKVEASMVITEVGTGQIKAMAGTRTADGDMLFNRATSPRQPGSSIKPLAVYAAALQKSYDCASNGQKFPFVKTGYDKQQDTGWGDYITVASTVVDEKMKVNGNTWPQNFSKTYSGKNNFRTAIQQSINTCAVKILAQVGVEYSMELVKQFGISTVVDDSSNPTNDINLAALGLGAMTYGVTPLDMALAYATFPNGGVRNTGICYTQVTDRDGNVLLEGKSEEVKVLDEGVAWIMTDVLQGVVSHGIAGDAAIKGEEVGGKTGTTDDTWDIWFDGFTANYSAALWIGTDDNSPLDATSSVAAALWGRIMGKIDRAKGGEYKKQPDNIIWRNYDYFTKGTEPPVAVKKTEKKEEKKEGEQAPAADPAAAQPAAPPAA